MPPSSPRPASASTVDPGREHRVFEIADGEAAKTLGHRRAAVPGLGRVGPHPRRTSWWPVGGGYVTDLVGFAAASYHRGVPVVHVPTTLLGMVDAAIGGKTGVNLPEGKNLVGAFWQPLAVLCDTDALATLPPRELRSGQGELAKYHFLTDTDLLALDLAERIAAAVRIKADVVAGDEREDPTKRRGPGDPQLRPHPRPRAGDRDRPTSSATARRWRSASPTPPRSAAGSAASTTRGSPSTTGCWRPTSSTPRCPPASTPTGSCR